MRRYVLAQKASLKWRNAKVLRFGRRDRARAPQAAELASLASYSECGARDTEGSTPVYRVLGNHENEEG